MNKKNVFNTGFNTGYDIADTNISELNPVSFTEEDLDKFSSDMSETESDSYRQYSPFEFFANDLNNSHDPDGLWESYENGVSKGIEKRIKEFKRENKKGFQVE